MYLKIQLLYMYLKHVVFMYIVVFSSIFIILIFGEYKEII